MVPSDASLLDLVRRTASEISAKIEDAHLRALLDGIDIALNELVSRQKPAFYLAHYRTGRILTETSASLLDPASPKHRALIDAIRTLPDTPDPTLRFDRIARAIDELAAILQQVVTALHDNRTEAANRHLSAVVDWEVSLFAHREQHADGFAEREVRPPAISKEALASYLRDRLPEWDGLEVTRFSPLVGGFSKTTLLFETHDRKNGNQKLVARVAPLHNFLNFDAYELPCEHSLLRYMHRAGLPIAEPLLLEENPAALGSRFLISRMAPGRTIGTVKAVAEPLSEAMVAEVARTLVRIHTLPLDLEDPDIRRSHIPRWMTPDLRANAALLIEEWRNETERSGLDPSPAIERALTWMADNIPDCDDRPSLLHGDFGVHNFLVEGDRITAVLDWEVSRAGDPADDITNFMLGSAELIDCETLMQHYVAAGGTPISTYRLRYYDVYQCLKMLVACLAALRQIDRWDSVGISHATFGYRYLTYSAARLNTLIAAAEAAQQAESTLERTA